MSKAVKVPAGGRWDGKLPVSPRPCQFHRTWVRELLSHRRAQGPLWLLCVAVSAQTGCQLIYMQWLISIVARFIYWTWKAEEWLLDGEKTQQKRWCAQNFLVWAVLDLRALAQTPAWTFLARFELKPRARASAGCRSSLYPYFLEAYCQKMSHTLHIVILRLEADLPLVI